jgi:hypothetical protein
MVQRETAKGDTVKKTKAKQARLTLAKAIANQTTIGRKLSVAMGQSFISSREEKFAPESDFELQHILTKWRTYGLLKAQAPDNLRDPRIVISGEHPSSTREMMLEEFAELGFLAATAIMDGNYKFFSRLAVMVQFNKRPVTHKLYADILDVCKCSCSGSAKRPCDSKLLHAQLVKRGHQFNSDHANQIPRTLRAVCKKLGVILSTRHR